MKKQLTPEDEQFVQCVIAYLPLARDHRRDLPEHWRDHECPLEALIHIAKVMFEHGHVESALKTAHSAAVFISPEWLTRRVVQ